MLSLRYHIQSVTVAKDGDSEEKWNIGGSTEAAESCRDSVVRHSGRFGFFRLRLEPMEVLRRLEEKGSSNRV